MGYRVEVTTLVEATCDRCGAVREVVIPSTVFWQRARTRLRALGWRAHPSNNGRSVLCPDCKVAAEGETGMTTEYVEVGNLALLRQVARPVLVRLWEAQASVWVPLTPEEWRSMPRPARDVVASARATQAHASLLREDRVVGTKLLDWYATRLPDEWGRQRLNLFFAAAEPCVPGLTPEHVTDAWDRGYRQIIVMRGDSLREGWDR